MAERTTENVFAHVLTERNMQKETYSEKQDAALTLGDWDDLIGHYVEQQAALAWGSERYVALVKLAAVAIAAAENVVLTPREGASIGRPDRDR